MYNYPKIKVWFFLKLAKDLKTLYRKKDIQMAKKHIKKRSSSLVIREMHTETTVRYHNPSTWTLKLRLTMPHVGKDAEQLSSDTLPMEIQNDAASMENNWAVKHTYMI